MDYKIGQEIITGTIEMAAAAEVGDRRPLTAWPDIVRGEYEIVRVDRDRGLIYGVITATAAHEFIPAIT